MSTWSDVERIALALPAALESQSRGTRHWQVGGKTFVWERPLRAADREHLGADAPDGPVVAIRVADVGVKFALVADAPEVFFTTPHFENYPAVLARLERLAVDELTELVTDAWLDRAPKRVVQQFHTASTVQSAAG